MIKNIIDNRHYKNTAKCDALVFEASESGDYTFDESDIVAYYQAIDIDELIKICISAKTEVVVVIYDLNSKPLK